MNQRVGKIRVRTAARSLPKRVLTSDPAVLRAVGFAKIPLNAKRAGFSLRVTEFFEYLKGVLVPLGCATQHSFFLPPLDRCRHAGLTRFAGCFRDERDRAHQISLSWSCIVFELFYSR
jgi:hypothetical protein